MGGRVDLVGTIVAVGRFGGLQRKLRNIPLGLPRKLGSDGRFCKRYVEHHHASGVDGAWMLAVLGQN